jgi:DNA-binding NarL/FixJ family response regulator
MTIRSSVVTLTEQRTKVLSLVLEGLSYKEIAAKLGISRNTVHYHVALLLKHYNVATSRELIGKFGHLEVSIKWVPNAR